MKGFNVKKLAAIATGAALLGTAVAPIVSAITVTKGDIYNADGTPKVNIVVGSNAAASDGVWAGNLAAKIAEKATTTKQVKVTLGSNEEGKEPTANLDLSDLVVDVTIGGKVTVSGQSKRYSEYMSSVSNSKEVNSALDGTNDSNALTDSTLPHLFNNSSMRAKVDNNSSTITVQEKVGVNVDAKFSTDQDLKDLVATISANDMTYQVNFGGTTGLDLGTTNFTDGSDDDVEVAFFGEKYKLNEAVLTGQKRVKLVKSSAKTSFNEGELIEGLAGDGMYSGKEVRVKVVQVVSTGPSASSYQATFQLLDSEGNVIDVQTVSSGNNLRDYFKDSKDDYALSSNLYVDTIATGATSGVGYVEVTKGSDTLELWDSKIYPYKSDYTGTRPYSVSIDTSGNKLKSIKISNTAEKWEETKTGYDLGALYPTNPGQSLTDKTGAPALFGQSWPDGTLGKGYFKVEFLGFQSNEERTTTMIGKSTQNLPSGSTGGITLYADDDTKMEVPFYVKVDDANGSFEFLQKPYSVFYDFGSSGKTGTYDVNVVVESGDYVNGRQWTLTNGAGVGVSTVTVSGYGVFTDVNDDETITVDGVTYKFVDANATTGSTHKSIIAVDTAVELFYGNVSDDASSKNAATAVFNTTSGTYQTKGAYGRVLLSNNSAFDTNTTVGLYGTDNQRKIYYVPKYNGNDLYLLLEAQQLNKDKSGLQNGHNLYFLGTSLPVDTSYTEVKGVSTNYYLGTSGGDTTLGSTARQYGYYVPKTTDFNSAAAYSASDAYFVAEFRYISAATGDANTDVYIDTSKGAPLGSFPLQNLTSYSGAVSYNNDALVLKSGSDSSYFQSMYTDAGSKYSVTSDDVTLSSPQRAEKVDIVVYGTELQRTVEGEKVSLKQGETKELPSGTKVTFSAVKGGTCSVSAGEPGQPGICKAEPASYVVPAPIRGNLVFLDTESPAGTNIIVGGWAVNKMAEKTKQRLVAAGDMVAEVDAASGDIYVAGYTAEDTGRAVRELINAIDALQ